MTSAEKRTAENHIIRKICDTRKEAVALNIAYTEQYEFFLKKYDSIFRPEHRHTYRSEEYIHPLSEELFIRTCYYKEEMDGFHIHASESFLQNYSGRTLYTWRNLNDDAEFSKLICHSNGRHYLIFRRDLYGYSVLELETLQEFHYIPHQAYPAKGEKFSETFIWIGVEYDVCTNLLAVEGCYWACPSSVVLLDFTNPLAEHGCEEWTDLQELIDADYTTYEDIEFSKWDGAQGKLHITAYNNTTDTKDNLLLNISKQTQNKDHFITAGGWNIEKTEP